jgi:hypothetical protein
MPTLWCCAHGRSIRRSCPLHCGHAPEVYRVQASPHLQSLEVQYGRVQATVLAHEALRDVCRQATA